MKKGYEIRKENFETGEPTDKWTYEFGDYCDPEWGLNEVTFTYNDIKNLVEGKVLHLFNGEYVTLIALSADAQQMLKGIEICEDY